MPSSTGKKRTVGISANWAANCGPEMVECRTWTWNGSMTLSFMCSQL
jgi:hypothetical protein